MTAIAAPVRAGGFHPLRTAATRVAPAARPVRLTGRGAGAFLRDGFSLLVVVLSLPFIILGLGLPLALAVRLVLWVFRVL